MDPDNSPRNPSITERAQRRRWIGIEKDATFTVDTSLVDGSKKVFLADPLLEDKLDSGDAVLCYFRKCLFPWLAANTESTARRTIMNLTPLLRAQTDKLLHILATNAGVEAGCTQPTDETARPAVFDPSDANWSMLRKCHQEWNRYNSIQPYLLSKCAHIQAKQNKRQSVFERALTSPFNWFFRQGEGDSFIRAQMCNIDVILALPVDTFGSPTDWSPFPEIGGFRVGEADTGTLVFDHCSSVGSGDDHDDDHVVVVREVGNLPALIEYEKLDIDRGQVMLSK